MKNTLMRWLRSGLALVLALCMVVSTPVTVLADTSSTVCADEEKANTAVDEAVEYCDLGNMVVDMIISRVIEDETVMSVFDGSNTSDTLKDLAIGLIEDELASMIESGEIRLEDYGMEDTEENRTLLAEEAYLVACIFYDEIEGNDTPETREVARKKCVMEMLRFALVTVNGYTEEEALEMAELYYELNEINTNQGRDAAVARAKEAMGGTSHTYGEPAWTWAEDCTSASAVFTCTVCNYSQTVVTKDITSTSSSASCETEGEVTYVATAVLDEYTKTAQKTVTVPAAGHSYTDVVTAPTCTAQGYTTHTCTVCGNSYVDTYVDALDHTWDEGTVTLEPTENSTGVKTYTCTVCGEKKEETIPAVEHTHSYTDVVTAPTCTEQGYTTHTCACGDSYVDTYVDALGHTEEVVPGKAATCTEDGLTEGKKCSVCGEVIEEQTVIPALGHTEVVDEAVAATCTATGLTEGSHCSVCNTVIKAQESVPMTDHTWDEGTVTLEPTEDSTGVKTYTCTVCGETREETIPALEHTHSYTDVVTAPTCTEQGYTTHTCACGETYVDTYVDALGHTEVTDAAVAPTCTATGLTEGSHCSVCNTVIKAQESVPMTDHTWDEGVVTKEPTSEEAGVKTYTCTVCGETKTEDIPVTAPAVTRVYGDDRYATAFAIADTMKEVMGIEQFNAVVISNSENFPDALAGSYLAAMADAPILLTKDKASRLNPVKEYISENLVAGGKVYILGSEGVVPASLENDLTNAGYDVERLAGSDRYETNLAVLRVAMELDPDKTKPILVSTGRAFADSLSVSASGLPLLLVRGDKTLTDSQKAFLEENADRARYVIGSEGVVYANMYEAVGATKRIAGSDRYETSVAVANELVPDANAVVLAYASDFPDGLCGGPLAYQMGASLILTKVKHEDVAANYVAENGIPGGYVLGSDSLVTDAVVNSIFNID